MDLQPLDRVKLDEIQRRLLDVLDMRLRDMPGGGDGTVRLSGSDHVVVELPGLKDLDAADRELSTRAIAEWYWARNVETDRVRRVYKVSDTGGKKKPAVAFFNQLTEKDVEPGTPEYAQMIKGWDLIMKGDDLRKAEVATGPGGGFIPEMLFSARGAEAMERWSRKYSHSGENLAAVLDGVVLSIAPLKDGAIISDEAVIEGTYDPQYVKDLVRLLNTGPLPVKLILMSGEKLPPR
jgi:preprotein translocase subunit SecD